MPRRLNPDEAALWARVAASVRPLAGRAAPVAGRPPRPIADRPPDPPAPPRRSRAADAQPVEAATLDGGWDRRIRTGRVVPDATIDLHGFTRDRAHAELARRLPALAAAGARVVLVVTGKGGASDGAKDPERPRGVIRSSLRDWLHGPDVRPYVAALRAAHPRHGGGGAWYVVLRR